ncbi:MAG: DUF488 domain-containing protein [Planctomycetaceae bacterium]|nr:MAG: DUF488 domain-containing protein [Planctomycetaceae bacterium]
MTIYTLGYSGWKIEDVEKELARLDAILVDVRMVPRTRWAQQWNASALHQRLGDQYVWLKQFGNKNYKGTFEQIEIADFPTGETRLRELLTKDAAGSTASSPTSGKSIILMCGCRDVNVCHRKVLAEWLAKLWNADVVHLTRPDNEISSGQPTLF